MMTRYAWTGLLLWCVALLLVAWILGQMPLDTIARTISSLHWTQWLAWSSINLLVILLATWRWRVLTGLLQLPVSFFCLLLIRQAGQLISFITPGPQFGGEPFQIYWLYRRSHIAIHSAVLALGLDRFYEMWINISVLVGGVILLLFSPAMSEAANWQQVSGILFGLLLLLSILGWVVLRHPLWITPRLEKLTRGWLQNPRLKKIDDHWQALGSDLQRIANSQQPALLSAFFLSLVTWAGIVLEMIIVLEILDINTSVSGVIFILVASRLALLLPLPGGIGSLEASLLWSFQTLGLPASSALGVIALMRLRDGIVLLAGLLCLRAVQADRTQYQNA